MKQYLLVIYCISILFGCRKSDINDKSRRNEHWAWWTDVATGDTKWLKVTNNSSIVRNGKYVLFYFNGNVREIGKLNEGKNVDTIFAYNIDGKLFAYNVLSRNSWYFVENGPVKQYYPDGKIWNEGVIQNHTFGDKWKKYYKNGKLENTRDFVNGIGWIVNYYENGNIKDSIYHTKEFGDFVIKFWYENGNLNESNTFNGNDFNGISKNYYENGQLKGSGEMVNGKRSGIQLQWYETGELKARSNYKNGKIEGQQYTYHKNGKIKTFGTVRNGGLNGEVKQFDEDGVLISDDFYKDGIKAGNIYINSHETSINR